MFPYHALPMRVQSGLSHSCALCDQLFIKLTSSELNDFEPTETQSPPLLLLDKKDIDDPKLPLCNDLHEVFVLRRYYQSIQSLH